METNNTNADQNQNKRKRENESDNEAVVAKNFVPSVSPKHFQTSPHNDCDGRKDTTPVSPPFNPGAPPPSSFRVPHTDQLSGRRTDVQQPTEIAFYSHDTTRAIHHNSRASLPYFHAPDLTDPTATNLSLGFPTRFIQRDDRPEPLDAILSAIHKNPALEHKTVDFCTWRGIMTKFLVTPYARRDAWTLRAMRYKGTIYIDEPPGSRKSFGGNERERLFTYYGYKFEQVCTNDARRPTDEEVKRHREEDVNTNVQYCSIVRTKIGGFGAVLAAEVDCADPNTEIGTDQRAYMELKTNRVFTHDKQRFQFQRHKMLKTWAQSFLIGVPKVVFGFRDDNGILREIKTYETREIPREVRGVQGMWDPSVCLAFAADLLGWLKTVVIDEGVEYTVQFSAPFQEIGVFWDGHRMGMLPKWFVRGEGPPG